MGWIIIKAGGSLTDGPEKTYERDVDAKATEAERGTAYADAHAFIDECKKNGCLPAKRAKSYFEKVISIRKELSV